MDFPQKYLEGQGWQRSATIIGKREGREVVLEGGMEWLAMKEGVWKKGKAKGDYQCSLEGVRTVRLLGKKEALVVIDKQSSRETTHRSNLQSFPPTQKPTIKLALQKLHHYMIHQRLRPSWHSIQSVSSLKRAQPLRKKGNKDWLLQNNAIVLYFPLLCSKLDEIKMSFLTKLRLQTRGPARPYELTLIFLLIRLQARLRYTSLQRAIRALKQ